MDVVFGSCSIPTYFPAVAGEYVDGGVGSYANPCYIAAYELMRCLKWDPAETTLISLGTGRNPHTLKPGDANRFMVWRWLGPISGAFLKSADDQQVRLVETFFENVTFVVFGSISKNRLRQMLPARYQSFRHTAMRSAGRF